MKRKIKLTVIWWIVAVAISPLYYFTEIYLGDASHESAMVFATSITILSAVMTTAIVFNSEK
jgi:hypothetical protein